MKETKEMTGTTFTDILGRLDITVPDETIAELTVPVLTGPQRQGDVGIWPTRAASAAMRAAMTAVPAEGIAVVRGEAATGANSHVLLSDGPVLWKQAGPWTGGVVELGAIHVPPGSTAWLVHTDEHNVIGMAPGSYRLTGKREQAEEVRRVAD